MTSLQPNEFLWPISADVDRQQWVVDSTGRGGRLSV